MPILKPFKFSPVVTTTAYAANDVLGAILTANVFGVIPTENLYFDSVSVILNHTAAIDLDIMLYSGTVITPPADNAAFTFVAAQLYPQLKAYIKLAVADFVQVQGTNVFVCAKQIPPVLVNGGKSPYSIALCTRTAFTPVATDILKIALNSIQIN